MSTRPKKSIHLVEIGFKLPISVGPIKSMRGWNAPAHRAISLQVRAAISAALNSSKAALVEAVVDAEERPTKPNELKA